MQIDLNVDEIEVLKTLFGFHADDDSDVPYDRDVLALMAAKLELILAIEQARKADREMDRAASQVESTMDWIHPEAYASRWFEAFINAQRAKSAADEQVIASVTKARGLAEALVQKRAERAVEAAMNSADSEEA